MPSLAELVSSSTGFNTIPEAQGEKLVDVEVRAAMCLSSRHVGEPDEAVHTKKIKLILDELYIHSYYTSRYGYVCECYVDQAEDCRCDTTVPAKSTNFSDLFEIMLANEYIFHLQYLTQDEENEMRRESIVRRAINKAGDDEEVVLFINEWAALNNIAVY